MTTKTILLDVPSGLSEWKDQENGRRCQGSNFSRVELRNFPGGPQIFELAAKFCYGSNFDINVANVSQLHCASSYLEMTEDYWEGNLITRTEAYLNDVVLQSLEKSVTVLSICETLPSIVDDLGIVNTCVDAIAMNASKEQLVLGLSRLDCDGGSGKLKTECTDWWVEDLSVLGIDFYQRVISALRRSGVRPDSIITSLMHYAQTSLKGIGKNEVWDQTKINPQCRMAQNEPKVILEIFVSLLPAEKSTTIPLNFLFGMLRLAITVDATVACRLELERRIGFRLEMVSLDDLLIPSLRAGDPLFDVDTVHRILVNFLQQIEDEESEEASHFGYESEGVGSPSHGSVLKVGQLIDSYLAEIAPDPYLDLQKFIAIIEILPDYARVIDDGLYRAVDIYLKAHPMLTENECKKLCKFIDCQKLSQEACNHVAQNDRLPVQMAVRVLYLEQVRLKRLFSGGCGDGFQSQRICSGVPSAAMSPRDNYASLRRENRDLKLEISRMRVRLSELEKEQVCIKQGMRDKSTFLTSLSRGIGRIAIFGGSATIVGKQGRKPQQAVS
ncbi:hypothetical protein IFM89_005330 [Coptis chinensis]|uniref:NPH3 domain-containing protein n=1 Tax=Coptis chinensis TaxID=261450 RepID=A0A835HAR6_9MAGN|nr:hypothetical protein IFM89_005330 [Coptis chinensis]